MVQRKVWSTYKAMTLLQKILAIVAIVMLGVLGILFLIYNHQVYEWLKPIADKWRNIPGGWLILFAVIFVCAFPPVIGYSTALTIAGFLYGFPNGWFVAAAANLTGSVASFIACKTFLSNYVHKLVGEDKRFTALALVLKHDGIKILVMIRLCPLPYSLSNGAMATFPTVSPLSFALATALATPKLLIHVFIGSRFAVLVDTGAKMDMATRIVNYASIIAGSLLGIGLGYYIYQRTVARARQLKLEENQGLARTPGSGGSRNGYFEAPLDDPEAFAAEGMDDDDISLWDNDEDGYRDASPSDTTVVDEEAMIGSNGPKDIGR
jgi:uncharacterized membrane protein YdjX (TVP38/TMEM64 family)